MSLSDMSEARTRKKLIEKALQSAGWTPVIKFTKGATYDFGAVEEYETDSGPCDYILFYKGRAIAAVEAKKVSLGPQGVLPQAERYARDFQDGDFNFDGYHLPFIFSTNGKVLVS